MDELQNLGAHLGVRLTPEQLKLFETFLSELITWNETTNLTAIREPAEIILKHFVDSLTVVPHIPTSARSLLDIGSGAGFPGLPIAIVCPHLHVTLLESVGKKTGFMTHMVKILSLTNVSVITARAEDLAHEKKYRESFDVVTARAVAFLPVLAEYALPFLKIGGLCIAQKLVNAEEIQAGRGALEILGGKLEKIISVPLTELPGREILLIEKHGFTPPEYPRIAGTPSKKPL